MHSVQTGTWDPRPPSKHASPLPAPPPPSHSRLAHVTSAAPAKRITFYKSGDNQFGGVRMAVHKRSFKCFDALLDDLSQKVPLPFGVRTVTTPRGTHTIKHLEQLQDGGCYLCSDQRQARPINMELAGRRPGIWYHQIRRPHRPETSSTTPPGHSHLPYRQRRILLVKNSEPTVRRTVVLSRRATRSLRAFLEEASEVMQFHVRKLYTVEGRKIDNVQNLMTCPGVLVCVGREAFSPILANFIRKSSEEKMPGLGPRTPGNGARSPATQGVRSPPHGAQSRASEYSEVHDSKKNVNFGLETKKSIIHPRSDSSTRSARFSLSSEKSYGNSLGAYSQGRPAIMNDDIEKRVLVNKDGSLSVEMRVRFRLQNDETVQWSTQIRKSPSLTNACCPLSEAQPHYLQQGQSESCSDPDSTSFDPEGVDYSTQPCALETNHCPCCYHRPEQKYDLWENPAHSHKHSPQPPPHTSSHTHTMVRHTHSSSSSSSCNSRRVVRCRARVSNCGGCSGSEQSQLVQEEMCVTEQVEHRVEVEQGGDTHVEVCKVSCSRSEVIAVDNNHRPLSGKSDGELMLEGEEDRPLSAVSSSSRVLQSLKEDQDDEDDDLPPSVSRCCHNNVQSTTPTPETQPNEEPGSRMSAKQPGGSRAASAASSCRCKATTPHSTAEAGETQRACSSTSRKSEAKIPESEEGDDKKPSRAASGLSAPTGLSAGSKRSSSVCPNCGGCKRGVNSAASSRASKVSDHSNKAASKPASPLPNGENAANGSEDVTSDDSAVSTQSNKTNCTDHGCTECRTTSAMSGTSNPEKNEEERAVSVASAKTHKSNKSQKLGATADNEEERVPSAMSIQSEKSRKSTSEAPEGERATSSLSVKSGASVASRKSNCQSSAKAASPGDNAEDDTNNRAPSCLSVRTSASEKAARPESVRSAKSNVSVKSRKSTCSRCSQAVSPGCKTEDEPTADETLQGEEEEEEKRAESKMSAKSNLSVKSHKSHPQSEKASETSLSPRSEDGGEGVERAASKMSGKSVKSNKSTNSSKSKCDGNEEATENNEDEETAAVERPESVKSIGASSDTRDHAGDAGGRAGSALSGKSASSAKSQGKAEVDRAPSAISAKSHASAKSSKSQKSNLTEASQNPKDDSNDNQERVASAMSAKSKSSLKSNMSHKSSCSKKPSNIVTIRTPEDVGDEEDCGGGDEKAADDDTAKSLTSEQSRGQTLSPRGTRSPRTCSPKATAASPTGSQSSLRQMPPGPGAGKSEEPAGLSVRSPTSVKSGRSKCSCGAAKKDNEAEEKEETELKGEEEVASIRSSSKRHTESRNSSGSVSLGLPEDPDTADSDSGKSNVSFQRNAERKVRGREETPEVPESPEGSTPKQEAERAASSLSQRSKANSNRDASSHNVPMVEISTIETPGGGENGEEGGDQTTARAASAISVKSNRSHKSSCNCSIKAGAQKTKSKSGTSSTKAGNEAESESIKSAGDDRTSSVMSSASAKAQRKATSVKNATAADDDAENASRPASEAKGEEDAASNKAASVNSQNPGCLQAESVASALSESKSKASKKSRDKEVNNSDYLHPVQSLKAKSKAESDNGSVKTAGSQKKKSSVKAASPCPVHSAKVEACSESTLSAADLLKETMAAARPHSQHSQASRNSDKPRNEKGGRCQRSRKEQEAVLTPACLPNASPNEVVSDWLRSIPADSCMLALDDVLNEEDDERKETEEAPKEEAAKEESPGGNMDEEEVKAEPDKEDKKEDMKCDAAEAEKDSGPGNVQPPGDVPLPKNWQSSTAVMKVLLSSSLGRCRSMPEVSPVYGRRLSTSARGLLDCLAQLQLIEPTVNPTCEGQKERIRQYEDIMAILHSLWLTEPRDLEGMVKKEGVTDQVSPPRSSSGLGMSSGSAGSGKDNRNPGGDEIPLNKMDREDEEGEKAGGVKEAGDEETEASTEQGKTDTADELDQSEEQTPATDNPSSSDKSSANDGSKSLTDNEQELVEDSSSGTPPTVLRAQLSKRLSQDPDPVWVLNLLRKLEKQFMSHYTDTMAEFKVRWDLDDSLILDTMICELKDEVSRRIQKSIQREMKKIQSRAGKVGRSPRPPLGGNLSRESTMTEKRRRMLKVMKNQSVKTAESVGSDGELTGDFSDQRSDDEYCPCDACVRKKMAARPFKTNPLAAEAPVMMEFDLLKILQLKKSPLPEPAPKSETEEMEEEDSVTEEKEKERSLEVVQEEEEEEETKEDIRADVVLEETIAEADEEGQEEEKEKTDAESEEKDEKSADSEEQEEGGTDGEENEENVTPEEGEEEEGEEEEEEEEGKCQCHANSEEDSDKEVEAEDKSNNTDDKEQAEEEEEEDDEDKGDTGEDEAEENEGGTGTGEEEEKEEDGDEEEEDSDKNTVKEASVGENENEKGEEDEGEEEAQGQECDDEEEGESSEAECVEKVTENEEEDEGEGESAEEESEEQQGATSEEENASPQDEGGAKCVCATEGEEADAEDSDADNKRLSDTGEEEEKESGGGGDEEEAGEDAVKEFKPEEDGDEERSEAKGEDGALLHQVTRTSVESQPGSLEDVDADPPPNQVDSIEVPKVGGGGGAGHRRSRSPARVKRRKPKVTDEDADNC